MRKCYLYIKDNLILYIIVICIDKRDVLKISNFLMLSFEIQAKSLSEINIYISFLIYVSDYFKKIY